MPLRDLGRWRRGRAGLVCYWRRQAICSHPSSETKRKQPHALRRNGHSSLDECRSRRCHLYSDPPQKLYLASSRVKWKCGNDTTIHYLHSQVQNWYNSLCSEYRCFDAAQMWTTHYPLPISPPHPSHEAQCKGPMSNWSAFPKEKSPRTSSISYIIVQPHW